MKKWLIGILAAFIVLAGSIFLLRMQPAPDSSTNATTSMEPPAPAAIGTSSPTPSTESAKPLSASELSKLAQLVTDSTAPQETRKKALYDLTQQGAAALTALSVVANSPVPEALSQDPHSADQIKQSFEASLRVTAIEALDEIAVDPTHTDAVKASMLGVLKSQKHRSLTLLAQISLSGIESGRPGKVKRAIEALVKEQK